MRHVKCNECDALDSIVIVREYCETLCVDTLGNISAKDGEQGSTVRAYCLECDAHDEDDEGINAFDMFKIVEVTA